jgi:P4 family phage/plasmid primase-like protien
MVCDQEGYQTLSPLGGKFNKTTYKQIISICKRTKEVILCFDKDLNGAGQSFLFDMSKILFNHNIDFWIYEFDDNMDLNEYYQKTGNIKAVLKDKVRGVEYLAQNIKDKQEFKAFVRNASRFVGTAEIAEVFEIAEEADNGLKKTWLKEVKKSAMRCPTEDHIMNVLVKKKDFLFNPRIGFHEYSSGCWRPREDEEVQGYIADELGHYRSGGRIGSMLKLLKVDVVNTEPFNQSNTLNFLNGTLMLDTGDLASHSKEQMSNIQIKYAYDSNIDCPGWLKFIDEITEFEDDKANLLQEIGGYVLFPDNSLQKAFILIGGGSNGKSVYLEILRKVFGEGNCTSVEVSNLNEDFQRIRLMNSLLNVSTEMKSSVGGAESIFKGIVAGDTVTGCRKHKDFIDFVPRVKMLCATNQMFKSNDMTHGFLRRLLFIKFNLEFKLTKDEVMYSYQRLANLTLPAELEQELAGIFNWCYEGYKRLRKQGRFSESREHKALIRELKNNENPHHMFFEELKKNEYSGVELYDEYVSWCGRKASLPKGSAELLFLADTATNKKFQNDKVIYMKR